MNTAPDKRSLLIALRRDYEVWDRPRLIIDTARRSPEEALAELRRRLNDQTRP